MRVLVLVRDDLRFMRGRAVADSRGNMPRILAAVAAGLGGIQGLHDAGLCHADIRNDHPLIECATGSYQWIDVDLDEDSPAFDVWSAGNILHCVAGRGFVTFHEAIRARPELASQLWRRTAPSSFRIA
ncbi:MAG: hypothetical protein JST11_30840 [Acidobacteria bacterium]|nr:hypothetical protein [Acidobacteriota bacterium]